MALPVNADQWAQAGDQLTGRRDFEQGLECYRNALTLAPGHRGARFGLGWCLSGLGRYEDAIEAMDAVLAVHPGSIRALQAKCFAAHKLHRLDLARQVQDRLKEVEGLGSSIPDQDPSQEALVRLLAPWLEKMLAQAGPPEFPNLLQEILKRSRASLSVKISLPSAAPPPPQVSTQAQEPPQPAASVMDAGYWTSKGDEERANGRLQDSLRSYRSALDKDRKHLKAWLGLAISQTRQRLYEEARASFDQASALAPQDAEVIFAKSAMLFDWGRWGAAAEGFGVLVRNDSKNAKAWLMKGAAEQRIPQRLRQAAQSLQRAMRLPLDPVERQDAVKIQRMILAELQRVNPWYARAGALLEQGKAGESLPLWDKAIEADPKLPDSWSNKGLALTQLEQWEPALVCLGRSVELEANPVVLDTLAVCLLKLGRFPELITASDKLLLEDPQDARAHFNKGCALRGLGKPAEALPFFDKALDLTPDDFACRKERDATAALLKT